MATSTFGRGGLDSERLDQSQAPQATSKQCAATDAMNAPGSTRDDLTLQLLAVATGGSRATRKRRAALALVASSITDNGWFLRLASCRAVWTT